MNKKRVMVIGVLAVFVLTSVCIISESGDDVDADSVEIKVGCAPLMMGTATGTSSSSWNPTMDCNLVLFTNNMSYFQIWLNSISSAKLTVSEDSNSVTINGSGVEGKDSSYCGTGQISGIDIQFSLEKSLVMNAICSIQLSSSDTSLTGPLHFVLEMEGLFNNLSKTKIVSFDLELMRPSESTFGIKVENNIGAEVNETAVFVHNIEYDNENGLAVLKGGDDYPNSENLRFNYSPTQDGPFSRTAVVDGVSTTVNYNISRATSASAGDLIFVGLNPGYATCNVIDSSGAVVAVHESQRYNSVAGDLKELGSHHVFWFIMPDSSVTIDITFSAHRLSIESDHGVVSAKLSNGSNTGVNSRINDYFFEGDSVQLSCEPSEGYELNGYEAVSGGVTVGSDGIFTMGGSDVTIKANYNAKSYTISYPSSEHGSVTGPSTATVGSQVSIRISPSHGYILASISATSGGGELDLSEVDDGRSFIMPAGDVVLSAKFEADDVDETMTCSSTMSGANTILDVSIACGGLATEGKDLRILVIVKYGDNVINVYSKPVIGENGVGTDRIVVSSQGLTSVVLELVDGIQPGVGGAVEYLCYCTYVPQSAGA